MILYSLELQYYKLKKFNTTSCSETFARLIKETIKNHKSRGKNTDENKHFKKYWLYTYFFTNIY